MFCYQCEQNSKGGCHTQVGICGKDDKTAVMQDILMFLAKGISSYAVSLKKKNLETIEYDRFVLEALFTTVTNVNFSASDIKRIIHDGALLLDKARKANGANISGDKMHQSNFAYIDDEETLLEFGSLIGVEAQKKLKGADAAGVEEMILYGLKGLAAYAQHARVLGFESPEIYSDINEKMFFLTQTHTLEELLGAALDTGRINFQVMELLDKAHTTTFGNPVPTKVRTTGIKGKAILVSGHDLGDMMELLKQTEGKGINIYTHSEMLPAHGYPELKKYKHLAGNYGGAWQDQQKEFAEFPGAILMTTNCIQKPKDTYFDNIFTGGLVQWDGVQHIDGHDYTDLIEKALALPGFTEDEEEHYTMTGFAHNAVLGVADKVIEGVKSGAIKHFFLVGGCDGAKTGRNYYTEFAQSAPDDTIILTLACGKYRFNKLEFGDIGGIPRLLDVGQCNDAYSAIKIAIALAEAFGTDVNGLPLSMILSWYEQKAVAILLTLLHLGVKNIRIGPSLPSFIEGNVLQILVDNFNLMAITTAEEDLKACLSA